MKIYQIKYYDYYIDKEENKPYIRDEGYAIGLAFIRLEDAWKELYKRIGTAFDKAKAKLLEDFRESLLLSFKDDEGYFRFQIEDKATNELVYLYEERIVSKEVEKVKD